MLSSYLIKWTTIIIIIINNYKYDILLCSGHFDLSVKKLILQHGYDKLTTVSAFQWALDGRRKCERNAAHSSRLSYYELDDLPCKFSSVLLFIPHSTFYNSHHQKAALHKSGQIPNKQPRHDSCKASWDAIRNQTQTRDPSCILWAIIHWKWLPTSNSSKMKKQEVCNTSIVSGRSGGQDEPMLEKSIRTLDLHQFRPHKYLNSLTKLIGMMEALCMHSVAAML